MKTIIFLFLTSFTFIKDDVKELDKFVNDWHLAAANADFSAYFDKLDESSIYIGTAPNERWTKKQFMDFSKPFFDKGKAWDFKSTERNWYFSDDGKTAWFDEVLDTWMMDCRGSGVMKKKNGKWKIMFYDLHVLIENEKINQFLDLRKK
ncbi:MAG: nuclear transport factor 2 family protein [Bacteroidota bacterium]